jgi:hypothetical protein
MSLKQKVAKRRLRSTSNLMARLRKGVARFLTLLLIAQAGVPQALAAPRMTSAASAGSELRGTPVPHRSAAVGGNENAVRPPSPRHPAVSGSNSLR